MPFRTYYGKITFIIELIIYFYKEANMDNLFNPEELEDALKLFNDTNEEQTEKILSSNMSAEMLASQKRYEDYIKKHKGDN